MSELEPIPDVNMSDVVMPSGFRRVDLVRLITQCLSTLGYANAAQVLQQDSGVLLLAEPIVRFQGAVLNGEWQEASSLVESLGFPTAASRYTVEFLLLRQKYMELLEAKRPEEALQCLRGELAPLEQRRIAEGCDAPAPTSRPPSVGAGVAGVRGTAASCIGAGAGVISAHGAGALHANGSAKAPAAVVVGGAATAGRAGAVNGASSSGGGSGGGLGWGVRELSGYMMCSLVEVQQRTGWDGAQGRSRAALLHELQQLIPPSVLLPENRLQTLLQQALLWQSTQCAECPPPSFGSSRALLEDFAFTRDELPKLTRHVIECHADEVWYLAFSHNGQMLASASKDTQVAIWSLTDNSARMLCGHTDAISQVAWSPNDAHVLTCACDQLIKLWNVQTGDCTRTFTRHTESVSTIAWMPDGLTFVSAGVDKSVLVWEVLTGGVLQSWQGARVHDLSVNHLGTQLLATCERGVRLCAIDRAAASEPPVLTFPDELWIEESESSTPTEDAQSFRRAAVLLILACACAHARRSHLPLPLARRSARSCQHDGQRDPSVGPRAAEHRAQIRGAQAGPLRHTRRLWRRGRVVRRERLRRFASLHLASSLRFIARSAPRTLGSSQRGLLESGDVHLRLRKR